MKKIAIVSTMMFVLTAFASTALANNGGSGDFILNKMREESQKRIEAKQDTTKNKKEETPCGDPKTEVKQKSENCKD